MADGTRPYTGLTPPTIVRRAGASILQFEFQSIRSRSPGYRADIDGLRAVAVASVIVYHLRSDWLPGGFVGVDVFFVISGYLITRVIQEDLERGRFSFAGFYQRRIRRILPALTAMALVCTVVAAWLLAPGDLAAYGRSLLAMSCFVSNLFFAQMDRKMGYFGDAAQSQGLLHTWSLSVEEQFYLVYPLGLVLLDRLRRRWRLASLAACAGLSFAVYGLGTRLQPVDAFYLLPTRAWELLLGALLAFGALPAIQGRIVREGLGLAGLGMVACGVAAQPHFNGALSLLLPCVGTCLVLYAGEGGRSLASWLLRIPPVVFLGVISYSLYLWHWPVIVLFRFLHAGGYTTPTQIGRELLLTLGLAFLSFELVESPLRRGLPVGAGRARARRVVWIGAGVSAGLACVALALTTSGGWPARFDRHTQELLAANLQRRIDWPPLPNECNNFMTTIRQRSDAVFCEFGHSPHNLLVLGDSHAQQLYPLLLEIQPQLHGEGLVFATAAGCPPTEHLNNAAPGHSCDVLNHYAKQRALENDIDQVFVEFSGWWYRRPQDACISVQFRCTGRSSDDAVRRVGIEELGAEVAELKARGKRVIVGLPFPRFDRSIPDYEIRVALARRGWTGARPAETNDQGYREALLAMAKRTGAEVYDPRVALCGGGSCLYEVNGVSLYIDGEHLAVAETGILRQGLLRTLEPGP
jgi:peptidoglycan/LPS O-acetylase OafA/YrhL